MDIYTTRIDQAGTQIMGALIQLKEAQKLGLQAGREPMDDARLNLFEGLIKVLQSDANPADSPKSLKYEAIGKLQNAISCLDEYDSDHPETSFVARSAAAQLGAALTYLAPLLGDLTDGKGYTTHSK